MRQFGCFKEMIESLTREGVVFQVRHCANSAGVFDFPLSHLDMVRAGIVIYGLAPSGALRKKPALKPVLSLKSVVSHVKTLQPGATVSYGREFTVEQPMEVATVPVGYADGYPRRLSPGGAEVLIRGKRCPILGRICMDQLMADVTGLGAQVGDVVTLIGRDGDEEVTADELAQKEGTINYEVVCGLSQTGAPGLSQAREGGQHLQRPAGRPAVKALLASRSFAHFAVDLACGFVALGSVRPRRRHPGGGGLGGAPLQPAGLCHPAPAGRSVRPLPPPPLGRLGLPGSGRGRPAGLPLPGVGGGGAVRAGQRPVPPGRRPGRPCWPPPAP